MKKRIFFLILLILGILGVLYLIGSLSVVFLFKEFLFGGQLSLN